MKAPHRNLSGHPIELDDGSVLAAGEDATVETTADRAKHHIEAGHLVKVQEPEKKSKGGSS